MALQNHRHSVTIDRDAVAATGRAALDLEPLLARAVRDAMAALQRGEVA